MPLEDDDYEPYTEEELFDQLAEEADAIYDGDLEPSEGSLAQALLKAQARVQVENTEPAFDRLYDSAYIETASGTNLTRRCSDIGIDRKPAIPSTGVVEWHRDAEPQNNYTIKSGVVVETGGTDPVSFVTTESTSIGVKDGFEDGALDSAWDGDTSAFTVQSTTVDDGTYAVETDATSGVEIRRTDVSVEDGDTIRFSLRLPTDGVGQCLYHVQDGSNHYRVTVDASGDVLTLTEVDGGSSTQLASASVTVPEAEWLTVEVDTAVNGNHVVTLIDASDSDLESVEDAATLYGSGGIGLRSGDASTKHFDHICTTASATTIEGASGGEATNVGPRRITQMPSPPTGVDSVVNPVATGNTSYETTSGNALTVGQDRETDEELRKRALNSTAIGGAATVPALKTGLREELEDVISAKVYENDTLNDNTGDGGLPPVSIEPVVYGATDADVAETLHRLVAPTERLYGGAHGTSTTYTISDDFLDADETYEWSRPNKVGLDVTLDLRTRPNYVGDDEVKTVVVDYIGGTDTDGSTVIGLGIGEPVYVDELVDRLVGSDTGVVGVASITIDADGDGTDDTSTVNGLDAYDTAGDTVAQTDGSDDSISISTTQI